MAKNAPTPRSEALGAVQMKPAGDAGHDAVATPEYTTTALLGIAKRLYHRLVIALLEGTLLDPHASPVLACPECCCLCCRCRERRLPVADLLSRLFADAGNTLRPTATGFRCGHEPVHSSSSGECVHIDPAKGKWFCHSCQQGGGPIEALMSLQGVSRAEAEAYCVSTVTTTMSTLRRRRRKPSCSLRRLPTLPFFMTNRATRGLVVPVGTHRETLRLRDRSFKRWLVRKLYTATGKTPNAEALSQALMLLEAACRVRRPTTATRLAHRGTRAPASVTT